MWNTRQAALQYDHWYDSPRGAFALTQETRLLQKMLSAWPRRGHSLLEVGCGTGRFLEFFWENGFDATGCDRNPAMLEVWRGFFLIADSSITFVKVYPGLHGPV